MAERFEIHFDAVVAGIPAGVHISAYWPPPDEEVDVVITDRRGYAAPWLERKLTRREKADVENAAIRLMRIDKQQEGELTWTNEESCAR